MMDSFILYTIKSSLILGGGYLLYFLLFRNATFYRFNRFLLLGIIFASLAVPLVKIQVKTPVPANPIRVLEKTIVKDEPVSLPGESTMQTGTAVPTRGQRIDLLGLIYLAGAAIQLVLILVSLGRVLLILRKSKSVTHQGKRLVLVPKEIVPFCFARRIFISEKNLNKHGNALILHEQTHQEKFHMLDILIVELYLVMTWYNPFSWLIRHDLKQNHEFEADHNVVRKGVDESGYQLLMVRTVAGEHRFHLANQFNQSSIKNRITMMNKKRSNPLGILKALVFIPLIILMIQVFAKKETVVQGPQTGKQIPGKYLELNPDQMKLLGFEYNAAGLFYKNTRADRKYSVLCCYFTEKEYSASILLKKDEKLPKIHHPGKKIPGQPTEDETLRNMPLTNYDFYPLVVSAFLGNRTLDMIGAEKDPKKDFLPVQFNMASLKLGSRNDTLVFWFPLTESLKKILTPIVSTPESYLKPIPPEPNWKK
jgi:hypothetical protein